MSKKRTRTDMLQRNVEQLEKRNDARLEFETNTKNRESAASTETEQQIRQRAYELYEARGREDGHDLHEWLSSEAEILRVRRIAAAA